MESKVDLIHILLGITYLHLGYVATVPVGRLQRTVTRNTPNRGVLLLLLDGVRWDQITSPHLTGFSSFIAGGVRAKHMEPVFPTNSFPNYFSIATGLWPESHGIIDNFMYDDDRQWSFQLGEQDTDFDPMWWQEGDPIWTTATRQNKSVHMYNWPGCKVPLRGILPAYCNDRNPGHTTDEFSAEVKTSLKAIRDGKIQFAGVYTEGVDTMGHRFGPTSAETNDSLRALDKVMYSIVLWLENTNSTDGRTRMSELVDVIVVSDHGMTEVSPERMVELSDFVAVTDLERYLLRSPATIAHLWPAEGRLEALFERLSNVSNITVYKNWEVPEEYHYRRHRRAAPILVVADSGWLLGPIGRPPREEVIVLGQHGYLPGTADMNAIFMARGPSFKKGVVHPAINTTDVYQLLCYVLNIPPGPHNGTWSHVVDMLSSGHTKQHMALYTLVIMLLILFNSLPC